MSYRPFRAPARLVLLALCLPFSGAWAAPVISEFLADNETGILDEDGERQDWIEIHNPDAAPVAMNGWYLTDSADSLTKWRFPAITLEPGEFRLLFASSKDRRIPGAPLHTNFSLAAAGEYLALVRPDGTTPEQQFSPTYPAQDPDRAFGLGFTRTVLSAAGSAAQYRVPTSAANIAADWKTPGFTPTGWTLNAPTGIGYGLTIPGMTMTIRRRANGQLNNLADVDALLALPSGNAGIAQEIVSVEQTFNVLGEGGDGHYPNNKPILLSPPEDYVVRVTGFIAIPTAGAYTFGINSDDGGRVRINGANVMVDDTLHGAEDHLGTVTLAAGTYPFEALFFERGGGDEGEFFAAAGTHTTWSAAMKLVGDTANGGLAVFTPSPGSAASGAAIIRTNIQSAMRNVNPSAFIRVPFTVANASAFGGMELALQYNDGFVAWLNGTEIARRNAPESPAWNSTSTEERTDADSLAVEVLNITSGLPALVNGANVLAIQGLNTTAADDTFLILPEIAAAAPLNVSQPGFLNTPTPARVNGALSSLGRVEDTSFTPKRGVYPNAAVTTVPFPVTITTATPGATIRYTLDGSTPTATYGTIYTAPVSISDNTVLRALAYKTGLDSTNVDTHTYILPDKVLTQSPTGAAPPGWPVPVNGSFDGHVLDYGMDPDIVNHANPLLGGPTTVKAALNAIPSLSLVTPLPNLFDVDTGIYLNTGGRGFGWERPASIEWINDPNLTFQADCGIRLRGGFSRSTENPKHAFHIYFRGEYGPGKLRVPLFGAEGAQEFNQIDIRTAQNYSWSFQNDGRNTFLREEFSRVTQLAMGQQSSRVRYFHLYLNGQYWGLYDTDERTEADFCSTYFGGDKENWDVVKAEQDSGYITGPTDGNLDAWHLLFTKTNPLTSPGVHTRRALTAAEYYAIQGLNADGVTANGQPSLIDVDNLIDYMLLTFWTGNLDGATSAFLGDDRANNWFGARDRAGTHGFRFFAHDFEHTLLNSGEDRTGPYNRVFTDQAGYEGKRTNFNPMFLHADLMDVPAYKKRFADRVQKHMFNGGALTTASATARVNALAAVVDSAIVAESARWGDAKNATPYTRANWRSARDGVLTYLAQRPAIVLNQLRADGLYPNVGGVSVSRPPGYAPLNAELHLSATAGGIFYTLDGSDPMRADGSLNPAAIAYQGGTTSTTALIAAGSAWKYRDPSIDLGSSAIVSGSAAWNATNWKHPDFNDSGAEWKTGNAKLGYGDGDEATVVPSGVSGSRTPVLYLRKQFTVTNPATITSLALNVRRDDGAIVYINGVEVGRTNMPEGEVTHGYSGINTDDEITLIPVTGPALIPSVLKAGTNTISVQVHNVNNTSSDLGFDLRLEALTTENSQPVVLAAGQTTLNARGRTGTEWSALTEAIYFGDAEAATPQNLAISEFLYHAVNPTAAEETAGYNDDNFFEYIEVLNTGSLLVDLEGVKFVNGVTFDFTGAPTGRFLAPGQRVLVVSNAAAFTLRYGAAAGAKIAGVFDGNLNNSGERLTLADSKGAVLQDLTYEDKSPWPVEPDSEGTSLVLINPMSHPDSSAAANWRAGGTVGGAPGAVDGAGYAAWKTGNGVTSETADPDGDGLTGVLEYAFGGSPATGDATARLPVAGTEEIDTGDGLEAFQTLSVTRSVNAEDAEIFAELSTDLTVWNEDGCELVSTSWNGDGTETLVFRTLAPVGDVPRLYLRARVRVP